MKALARFIAAVPVHDHPIKLQNLLFQAEELTAERDKTCARNCRHPFLGWVGNNMQQLLDALAPDRRNNAELRKVSSDRVNQVQLPLWTRPLGAGTNPRRKGTRSGSPLSLGLCYVLAKGELR